MPLVPPWRRRKQPATRAVGSRRAGPVLRGPPIAVTCECGEKRDLRYGEDWVCESCGRRWDTRQIPAEQYETIRRTQLRFRVLPVVYGLGRARARDVLHADRQHLFGLHPAADVADALVLLRATVAPPALPAGDSGAPALGAPPRMTAAAKPPAPVPAAGLLLRRHRRRLLAQLDAGASSTTLR